jgi:hypothetical protein
MPEFHAEPYLYLAGLTHKSALIAWGAFYFRITGSREDGRWKLVDDRALAHVHPPRAQTIGARSEPYGEARVEVREASTEDLVAVVGTSTTNHVLVTGLAPDTAYRYTVTINGEAWAAGERRDWMVAADGQHGLRKSGRVYVNQFRTHPHPASAAPLCFAVLGDYGTGVRKPSTPTRRQREVAFALEQAVTTQDVRLLLTTGDNIYAAHTLFGLPLGETGDDDDDWFFTFYQPYRYLLNQIPVYPCVGNHDTGETEQSDDRTQLLDNFYLHERFAGEAVMGRALLEPGLFYRFCYGADIEFVCIDTSKQSLIFGDRLFKQALPRQFLAQALPLAGSVPAPRPRWRIPFLHHPPYTAGPRHHNSRSILEELVPLWQRAGVQVVFSGHEHNFQYSVWNGIHYVITGAAGKVSHTPPTRFAEAHTVAWAAASHCLLVTIQDDQMTIRPLAEGGAGQPLADVVLRDPAQQPVVTPLVIIRTAPPANTPLPAA